LQHFFGLIEGFFGIFHSQFLDLSSNCHKYKRPLEIGMIRLNWFGIFIVAACTLLWAGCSFQPEERVIVLHTGRMFGNAWPLSLRQVAPIQHYPRLAGCIRGIRQEAARLRAQVVLIDSGGSLFGSFASYVTGGRNMTALFNYLDYDAVCLDNLDSSVHESVIRDLKARVLCPFVTESGKSALLGAVTEARIEKADLTVILAANFLGQTGREDSPLKFPVRFGGNAPVFPALDHERRIKNNWPQSALSLALFHWMKFEPGTPETTAFMTQIEREGIFDAILAYRVESAGQTPSWPQPIEVATLSRLPFSMNFSRRNGGFSLARLDLIRQGGRWRAKDVRLLQMTANTALADQGVKQVIEQFAAPIRNADALLTRLPEARSVPQLLDAYMLALSRLSSCNAVLCAQGCIRSDIEVGPLTASRLFDALPWTGDILTIQLSQPEFHSILAVPGLRILRKKDFTAPVVLVTTEFFAGILTQRFGFDPARFEPASNKTEFEYFRDHVQAYGARAFEGAMPQGWIYENTR
jgi:hypothetical protein